LLSAVKALKPTMLIGVSGQPRTFTEEIVKLMARFNEQPVIFALSNPTSKSECTAEEAYTWTQGRVVFASGSPFPPVTLSGRTYVPGQANNAYIFPGVGLGVVISAARRVTEEMFSIAARTLADLVTQDDLAQGRIYPALSNIREVSARIAAAVAETAYWHGLARLPKPDNMLEYARSAMYQPTYEEYV
jgi:malate dehydrogenase (oxaloacetate-decarboxylating)(NADP+)